MPVEPMTFPDQLETERLRLCAPRRSDAEEMRAAVAESFEALHRWMDWAQEVPSLEVEREIMSARPARHDRGEEATWLMRRKTDAVLVGCGGLPRLCWDRRCFEIGYWVRTPLSGNGYVTEFVAGIRDLCFERFAARRVEICTSTQNPRSRRVAELAGFRCERVIEQDGTHPDGSPRDTVLYVAGAEEGAVA